MKAFAFLINVIYWLGIFISPVIILGFIALWLYSNNTIGFALSISIGIVGAALGILLAEYVRKKYGLDKFFGGVPSAPDIEKEKDTK